MNIQQIAAAIRARICLALESDPFVLHEGELATEFGVSRTPIRQALQRLAYERLVQTRSGVGTVAAPLLPETRDRDIVVHRAILRAAASASDASKPSADTVITLQSLAQLLSATPLQEPEAFFEVQVRFLNEIDALIDDEILRTAHRSAHLRAIRWRLRDFTQDFASVGRFAGTVAAAASAADGRAAILNAVADGGVGTGK